MESEPTLHVVDYIIVVLLMLVSAAIGIYYGAFKGRQQTSSEFFLADRSMHWLPVSVSVAVSVISAITFLGTTALSYFTGMAYLPTFISRVLAGVFTAFVICPVFYNLKITSIYEYLERRFNPIVRYIAVVEQILLTFLILGVVVYAPALALNAVTGLSLTGSILAVGIVSTFYSSIGGIKAVVWTDCFQSITMVVGMLVIIIVGCVKSGGVGEVWFRLSEGQRTNIFDFRIDPRITLSFWSTVIGGTFQGITYGGTNQNQCQRYLTCKDLRNAKWASFSGFLWAGGLEVMAVLAGLVIFSFYHTCDPYISGQISNPDQILPFFVVDIFRDVPGLPGLIVSAIFSASLSTISTAINGMTTVTGEDFVKRVWPQLPDDKFTKLMKLISVCYGLSFMLMAFVASVAGSLIIRLAQAVVGAISGPVLGVFLLGILVPRANSRGALVGMIVGSFLGMWILVGSLVYPNALTPLPLSTDTCSIVSTLNVTNQPLVTSGTSPFDTSTLTIIEEMDVDKPPLFAGFYAVSFLYFAFIATMSTFLVGLIGSFLFPSGELVGSDLLSPVVMSIYFKLPHSWRKLMPVKLGPKENNEKQPQLENANITDDDTKI